MKGQKVGLGIIKSVLWSEKGRYLLQIQINLCHNFCALNRICNGVKLHEFGWILGIVALLKSLSFKPLEIYFTTKSVKSNIWTHVESISEEKFHEFMWWWSFYFMWCQWSVWVVWVTTNKHTQSSIQFTSNNGVTRNMLINAYNVINKVHWCV